MTRFFTRFAIAMVVLLSVSHARAQPTDTEPGRYTMSPADNGFVRLDRQSGEMAFCQRLDGIWSCAPMDMPGARVAPGEVSDELRALRRENRRLRDEVARLDEKLASGAPPVAPRSTSPVPGLNLPSEAEVDRAIGYFGNILKKLKDQIEELNERPRADAPSAPPAEEKQL